MMSAKARWRCLEVPAWPAFLLFGLLWPAMVRGEDVASLPTEPLVLSVVINGTLVADAQLLHRELQDGRARVWFPEKEAMGWRMDLSHRERRSIEGVPHAAFCDQRDRCFYDDSSALLTVTLDNVDILPLRFTSALVLLQASPEQPAGAYLNYDLSAWHVGQPGASALLEGRAYSAYGHGALRVGGVVGVGNSARTLLQGVWQVDRPEQGISLQAGSIAIPDTTLGVGLALTGVRVGSNRALQPLKSNALRPRVDGVADRSLRADVFVDGLFRQTAQVPYGPYSIEVQPLYPGKGEIDMVTTDITGLQARRTLTYYNAPQMLAPSVTEWSLDAGLLSNEVQRMNLGQPALASATVRRGMTLELTAQSQLLIARRAQRLVLAVDSAHAARGVTSLSAVWQKSDAEPGGQLWLGAAHEYLSRDVFVNVKTEQAVSACRPASVIDALADRLWRPCRLVSAGVGLNIGARWSLTALTEVRQDHASRHTSIHSLGARLQVGSRSQLGVSLQRIEVDGQAINTFYISWSQPLGGAYEAQVGLLQRSGERASLQWTAQSAVPIDALSQPRRFQTYGSAGQRNEAGVRVAERTAHADWRADAKVGEGGVAASVGMTGAIGVAEGRVFTSRRIDDAFILVDVGLPDLPVLLDNREVARTNAAGWAIVPEGRAYQLNNIGVDASALPIEYAMPRDQQAVVPASGAGVVARFDVSDGGVAVAVLDDDGQPLPAGAPVQVSGQRLPTAVTSRSEVFLERSDRAAEVTIEWHGQRCRFRYTPQEEPPGGHRCTRP